MNKIILVFLSVWAIGLIGHFITYNHASYPLPNDMLPKIFGYGFIEATIASIVYYFFLKIKSRYSK